MNPKRIILGTALTFSCFLHAGLRALADPASDARHAFEDARTAVQEFQDAERNKAREKPEEVERLAKEARAQVERSRKLIEDAIRKDSLGPQAGRALREFQRGLEYDLGIAWGERPKPTIEPEPAPADLEATSAPETVANLEKFATEIEDAWSTSQKRFSYYNCGPTLKDAFTAAGVKDGSWEASGNQLWMASKDQAECLRVGAATIREASKSDTAASSGYDRYIAAFMPAWREGRDQLFSLFEKVIKAETQYALEYERGRAKGLLSFENKELPPLEAEIKKIRGHFATPNLVPLPIKESDWNQMDGAKRRQVMDPLLKNRKAGRDYEAYEGLADGAERVQAVVEALKALDTLRERAKKGEVPTPAEIQAALDAVRTAIGDDAEQFDPLLESIGGKLETAEEVLNFLEAVTALVDATQEHETDDPTVALKKFATYLRALKPVADRVPGLGEMFGHYVDSLDLAADQLSEVWKVTQERRRAGNELWENVIEGKPMEFDRARDEALRNLPELPEGIADIEEPADPAQVGPRLTAADRAAIDRDSRPERERMRRAQDAFVGEGLRFSAQQDALAKAEKAGNSDRVAELKDLMQRDSDELRRAYDNMQDAKRWYEEKVQELTREALNRK